MKRRPNRPTSRPRPKAAPRNLPKRVGPKREAPAAPAAPAGRTSVGPPAPRSTRPNERRPESREAMHVAPLEVLAESAAAIAARVERGVLDEGKRADRTVAAELRPRRDLAPPDHRFISEAVFALLRWRGWIEPLELPSIESRLLLAWLLD